MRRHLVTIPDPMLISLSDAKSHLAAVGTTRDSDIESAIKAGYSYISSRTGRALVNERWRLYLDEWQNVIHLPMGKLQGVESVKYWAADGVEQAVASSHYTVVGIDGDEGYIAFKDSFNPLPLFRHEPICIEFTAGWSQKTEVPELLIWALKLYIGILLDDDDAEDTIENLLINHRLEWV